MKIVIEEKAIEDIREVHTWYYEKSIVAAENFQKELTLIIESLQSPTVEYRKLFARISIIQLKIFPYNLYFIKSESEAIIQVLALLHNKRDSRFVTTRLQQ